LIIEDSLRRHLKLDDAEGISSLSNEEIFEHLARIGSKKTAWDQFSSNIATTLICLASSRRFNFSKFIFEAMVKNLDSPHKFLLYPRIDGLEKDLQKTKKTYSTALTKLVLRVKKLEYKLKSGKARRKAKIEDKAHEKPSNETEVLVQEETPTEIIKEHGSGKKCEIEISTANIQVSTASPPKKVKKRTQVQLSMDEEIARKMEEEEEERLNLEATRELQRQLDQRQEVPTQPTQSQGIDWNDPSVLRYHALKNKPVSIAQARRNMLTYLKNQRGSEVEKDSSKPSERETSKIVEEEKDEEEDVNPEPVLIEKKDVGIRRKTLARRRASNKQGQDSSKRQKKEKETADYVEEKDELRMWLTVVPDEEEFIDPEILHTKFPIVDWESQSLYNMHVYKIIRADGNTSYHKTFESMLKSFDRNDLEVLHRLVMERFQDNTPKGYNLMLWGDLKILVDLEQDDDIWKNQNQWKIISWKRYETCGVHTLMVDGTLMTIHMFVNKKYPLAKETLQKMLNWKLEAEAESFMAFELLKLIKTQIEEQ
ncbi:hypothetical protein Tco_0764355, partial [Tanacetum coccineum]